MGVPFPKFDLHCMFEHLPPQSFSEKKIGIEFSGATTFSDPLPTSAYGPHKHIPGVVTETNIMVYQLGGPGAIILPGLGQFMMIEKPKIK